MVDELDSTAERIEFDTSIDIANICAKAGSFVKGVEGDCDLCGEHFSRVIETTYCGNKINSCGRCRDKYGIK